MAAAGGAAVLWMTERYNLRRGAADLRTAPTSESGTESDLLTDPRSCFQVALTSLDYAIRPTSNGDSGERASRQLVNLLRASPRVIFSEVVDDRTLVRVEQVTAAKCIWIISSNESIEFEYSEPDVSFSPVVMGNLERGISYRYLVIDTRTTRDRARRLTDLVREKDLDERLQIRFLSSTYWAGLERNTDEIIVFDGPAATDMFYLFPGSTQSGGMRRWIRAPRKDAERQSREVLSTWELTSTADLPAA
jgi:hypothetical protein